ncbi:MAG: TetR/AcrR family transcriptional regulator [Frankiaceae bacterium]
MVADGRTDGRTDGARRLRADARRNQEQVLAAARDVFVERGPGAALEEVARRAGVGIATLYRRFPDREALLRAVVLDALGRTREAAERALAEETSAFDALVRYMHEALDLRISAVIPLVLDRLDLEDAELRPAREASARAVEAIVDAAHEEAGLPADVTFGDIGLLLVRLARPLPGPIPAELGDQLAHRHLDLLIEGLRALRDRPGGELTGPALSRADLRAARTMQPARREPRPSNEKHRSRGRA